MTRKQNPYREKGLSVFLTVLMVLSVVAMGAFVAGPVAADHVEESEDPDRLWAGQVGVFNVNTADGETVDFYEGEDGEGDFIEELVVENGQVEVDTDGLATGDYSLDDDGTWINFEVRSQSLSASFADDPVEQTTTELNVQSNRASFDLEVSSEDFDEDELEDIFPGSTAAEDLPGDHEGFVVIEDRGDHDVDFSDVEPGNYSFDLSVADSDAETTVSISVEEEVITEFEVVGFTEDEYSAPQTDTIRFSIDVENADQYQSPDDDITILIEDSNADYTANVTISNISDDAETITIDWIVWNAGADLANHPAGDLSHAVFAPIGDWYDGAPEDAVAIEQETDIGDNILATDIYFTQVFENPDQPRVDTTNLRVSEATFGELETFIAPQDSFDLETDSTDHIEDNMSAFDDVAEGDLVVLRQEANGLFNYMWAPGAAPANVGHADAEFGQHADDLFVDFEVELQSPLGQYDTAPSFNETDDNVAVHTSESDSYIYIVIDTENVDVDMEDGHEWSATFAVDSPVHDDVEAESSFSVLERDLSFATVEGNYQVAPIEDSEIHLTTTLAPGSEIDGELDFRPVGLENFDSVEVVEEDGERTVTFVEDLSAYADHIDEEFDLEASGPGITTSTTGVWNMTPEHETTSTVAQLEQQIAELQGQLEDRDATIADLESQISDLEGEVADQRERADAAESDLADANDRISELEGQVSDLETRDSAWQSATGVDNPEDYEAADDDDEQPAFGPVAALIALLAGGALVARRRL